MRLLTALLAFLSVTCVCAVGQFQHVFRESSKALSRSDVHKLHRVDHTHFHTVVFAVKQRNLEELERVLHDVSDPRSANYGKHWSRDQVVQLTGNKGANHKIQNFLTKHGVQITDKTQFGDYIFATAPISVWEDLFACEFHWFKMDHVDKTFARANHYSLPKELHSSVHAVFNTVQFPMEHRKKAPLPAKAATPEDMSAVHDASYYAYNPYAGYVTPPFLNNFYNISNNTVSFAVSQAVYETGGQSTSPTDLADFQSYFSIPQQPITRVIGGHADDNHCTTSTCGEASLDVQYMMAIAQGANMTYYYSVDWMFAWIIAVANSSTPSDVYSISYGSLESGLAPSYTSSFNTEAIKLGVMGTTIVVASGDYGAASYYDKTDSAYCSYSPFFPASSPYVTAVGATQGPEAGSPEVVCQATPGGDILITSGGGFSSLFPRPSWQASVVDAYFALINGTDMEPYQGTTSDFYYSFNRATTAAAAANAPSVSEKKQKTATKAAVPASPAAAAHSKNHASKNEHHDHHHAAAKNLRERSSATHAAKASPAKHATTQHEHDTKKVSSAKASPKASTEHHKKAKEATNHAASTVATATAAASPSKEHHHVEKDHVRHPYVHNKHDHAEESKESLNLVSSNTYYYNSYYGNNTYYYNNASYYYNNASYYYNDYYNGSYYYGNSSYYYGNSSYSYYYPYYNSSYYYGNYYNYSYNYYNYYNYSYYNYYNYSYYGSSSSSSSSSSSTSSFEYHDYIGLPTYFNSSGRGYPDISLMGHNYVVNYGGSYYLVDGTSASTPVFGGMVTLLNYHRQQAGQARMGFINPFLYTYSSSFVRDITSGDNKCGEAYNCGANGCDVTCCQEGFYATEGWDATTGLGSVDYDRMLAAALAVSASTNPTQSPTASPAATTTRSPTRAPTFAAGVTAAPTVPISIAYSVSQVLNGVTQSSYNADPTTNNQVMQQTVATEMNLPTIDITITSVTAATTSVVKAIAARLRTLSSSSSAVLVTYAVNIPNIYAAGYTSPNAAYTATTTALNTSIATGHFNSVLQTNAAAAGSTALVNATSSAAVVSNFTAAPASVGSASSSSSSSLSGGAIAGIVIGVLAGLLLISMGMYYVYLSSSAGSAYDDNEPEESGNKQATAEPAAPTARMEMKSVNNPLASPSAPAAKAADIDEGL